jgi:hypothetical protein
MQRGANAKTQRGEPIPKTPFEEDRLPQARFVGFTPAGRRCRAASKPGGAAAPPCQAPEIFLVQFTAIWRNLPRSSCCFIRARSDRLIFRSNLQP